MMKITDTVELGGVKITDEGYLVCNAKTARAGVQQYSGTEMGKPQLDMVNVYRPATEVFAKQSLETFSRIPITVDHPDEHVNASNWRALAVGTTGDEVLRDGECLKIGLKITDADAVATVRDGKRELSVGYVAKIVWGDGTAPDGTPYQAMQKNIVANHIAIVDKGRAGHSARIGDNWCKIKTKRGGNMKTIILGDATVQAEDADARVIEQFKATAEKALADAQAAHDKALAAKDGELAKLQDELKVTKEKILSDAALDARVEARAKLVADAAKLAPELKTAGLSDAEIKRAVVESKIGDTAKDKSAAYIDARFDVLVEDYQPTGEVIDPVADALKNGVKTIGDAEKVADEALKKSIDDLNAWRAK